MILFLMGCAVVAVVACIALALWVSVVASRQGRGALPFILFVWVAGLVFLFDVSPVPRIGWDLAYYVVPEARPALVHLDFALSAGPRASVVAMAADGELGTPNDRGGYWMPGGYQGLSRDGDVSVLRNGCGVQVFFMTITGFSPDPYAGFEFSAPGCPPETDPLGSGHGIATDLGGGWYWIEAS